MLTLQDLPQDVIDLIIELLVITIGIQKAILLRTVSKAFDIAILQAVCVSQVLRIDDPATPFLLAKISSSLKGKIFLVDSKHVRAGASGYLSVITSVNRTLDGLVGEECPEQRQARHESVAAAVNYRASERDDAQTAAQNILSGAAILGNLAIFRRVQGSVDNLPVPNVHLTTPYFDSLLTLAAARGHVDIVRHLLACGARMACISRDWAKYCFIAEQPEWNLMPESMRHNRLFASSPSALRAAVLGGHKDIFQLLMLPWHRLPLASLEYIRTIVAGAAAGRLDLIDELSEATGKPWTSYDGLGQIMLRQAVRYDKRGVVQMLLREGVGLNYHFKADGLDPTFGKSTPLEIAACVGNVRMASFLLERGAVAAPAPASCSRLDCSGAGFKHRYCFLCSRCSPIEAAALRGHETMVSLLLQWGGDPSEALCAAARGGEARLFKSLLERLPKLVNDEEGAVGIEALYAAASSGNLTILAELVKAGVFSRDVLVTRSSQLLPGFGSPSSGAWLVNCMRSLGVSEQFARLWDKHEARIGGVCINQRTWEWAGRY